MTQLNPPRPPHPEDETLKLVADHMEGGFLENIMDMFRHDTELYSLVPSLMHDERTRVRLGTVALVEALMQEHGPHVQSLVPGLSGLLGHEAPAIRADAAYLMGIIGGGEAIAHIKAAAATEAELAVRHVLEDTLEEFKPR